MRQKIWTLLFIVTFCTLTSCGIDTLEKSRSVNDAKEIVNNYISSWDSRYKRLCDKPHNDNLKMQFQRLHDDMTIISGCGELCNKLSYEEQNEVSTYGRNELNKYSHLRKLLESSDIECW